MRFTVIKTGDMSLLSITVNQLHVIYNLFQQKKTKKRNCLEIKYSLEYIMNTIILNSTHLNANKKNQYIYNFPSNQHFTSDDTIALSSISLYNSIYNVEASRGNNTFSIIWNADTSVQYDFTIADGFYSISDLNYAIQYECIQNGLYAINTVTGKYSYYVELIINNAQYGPEIRCYYLPDSTEAGTLNLIKGTGATWDFHASLDQTPQLIVSAGFGGLIGFSAATYPAVLQSTNYSIIHDIIPEINPVNSLVITCNLVNSPLSIPNNVFYSMPINSSFGSMMTSEMSTRHDTEIAAGTYRQIILTILDQSFVDVVLHDTECVIKLNLRIKPKAKK